MDNKQQEFYRHLEQALTEDQLVRITLSKPRTRDQDLQKVMVKPVLIKGRLHLSFTLRHATQDVTKNHLPPEGIERIQQMLQSDFFIATLFTTEADHILKIRSNKTGLRRTKPTFRQPAELVHDKVKEHAVKAADYLTELGVTDAKGRIERDMGDKFKQINKFVEIMASLIEKSDLKNRTAPIRVVDMGAGKGYLTFAVYDYLVNKMDLEAKVTGVEIRPDLIEKCNIVAKKLKFRGLHFELGYIADYELPETDILIALHACDTATDDAIQRGIAAGAELIVCAPCCHKQIRRAIQESRTMNSVLRYGILKERQAEIVTDTIRAMLLEAHGYKTKVFEFISSEHTGKNVMIAATKHSRTVDRDYFLGEIEKLKAEFGIEKHYLEEILG